MRSSLPTVAPDGGLAELGASIARALSEQAAANPGLLRGVGDVLRAEIERAVLQAVADAFRTLADELPRLLARPQPALAPPAADGPPAPTAPPAESTGTFSLDRTVEVACPPSPVAGHDEQPVAAYTAAIHPDPSRAVRVLRGGLAHLGQGEYQRAAADADEALHLNPALGGAYLLRATVRIKQGRNDEAVADLTSLLRIKPGHAAAYHARGLAHANQGSYDPAIADYNRALRLRPNLVAARFHRAVAYRLKGEYAIAVAEFGAVLQARPDHLPALYQRALAHQARGHYALALADLDAVLGRDATSEEARRRRAEVVEARQRAAAADRPDAPASRTALALTCPGCGAAARLDWKRLDRPFKCRACGRIFRVNGEGQFTEADPSGRPPRRRRLPAARALGLAAGACLVALLVVGISLHHRAGRDKALAELPAELTARGELWARAWLDNDRPLLRRLTAPTHDRQLHPWLMRHRPPPRAAGEFQIEVRVLKTRPHEAVVIVRITASALPAPVELRLNWVEQGEAWYFHPA